MTLLRSASSRHMRCWSVSSAFVAPGSTPHGLNGSKNQARLLTAISIISTKLFLRQSQPIGRNALASSVRSSIRLQMPAEGRHLPSSTMRAAIFRSTAHNVRQRRSASPATGLSCCSSWMINCVSRCAGRRDGMRQNHWRCPPITCRRLRRTELPLHLVTH